MSIERAIHKLKQPKFDETLCGIEVNAIYPMSNSALQSNSVDPIRITFFKGTTCKECKEKDKE